MGAMQCRPGRRQLTSSPWPACSSSSSTRPIRSPASATGCATAGMELDERHIVAGDDLPETLDGFDGLVVLGGPQSAMDDEATSPELVGVRDLLGQALAADFPTLAICLGAQLLAQVGGGRVREGIDGPEVGATLVAKRDAADADPLFAPAAAHARRAPVPPRRDLRAAHRGDPAGQQPDVRQPGVPGGPARLRAAVPHRDDAGDHPRVGRAGRGRRRCEPVRPGDHLPALRRRASRTSKRRGRRSPAGSPTWSAPAPARPPDRHEQHRGGDPAPGDRAAGPVRLRGRRAGGHPAVRPGPRACGTSSATSPPTPRPGPVVAALARAGDPDLALRSLHRLVEALDHYDHIRRRGRRPARRPARIRAAAQPAAGRARRQLRASPTTWPPTPPTGRCSTTTATASPAARPARRRRSCAAEMLAAVGADPDDPPWGVRLGKGAPDASPKRIAALRLAYRRAILSLAGPRPRRRAGRPRRPPPSWPTSPPPCSPPGWRSPSPSSRPPPPPAGSRSSRWARPAGAS